MIKLSICIPTYNQVELLRSNVQNLLRYPGNDIQIVVSDNCSEDDIREMLESFHDPRIKYCCTESNIGQARNILFAFQKCDSPYVFLLRTKDTILPEMIPTIIETVHRNPNVGYWRFNCIDQSGNAYGWLPSAIYKRGREAVIAQDSLMRHPSGEVYNLNFFTQADYQMLDYYMTRYFSTHLGFIVDLLMRKLLATRSEVATSDQYVWVLLTGATEAHGSVNQGEGKTSIFAPEYVYPRYICEMDYITHELPPEYHTLLHTKALRQYCQCLTVSWKFINQDKMHQQHYHCEEKPVSISAERRHFFSRTMEMIKDYPSDEARKLKWYTIYCLTFMQLRWNISHYLGPLIKVKLFGFILDIKRKLTYQKKGDTV